MDIHGPNQPSRLQNLVYSVLLVILAGYLLVIGRSLLVPIFVAVISVYILVSASNWLGIQPVTRFLPLIARRVIVLLAFILAIAVLTGVIISTAGQIVAKVPVYQQNLDTLADSLLSRFGIDVPTDWNVVWDSTIGRINVQSVAGVAVGRVGSLAGVVFLVVIYAMFLMGERGGFAHKISLALPGESGRQSQDIIASINASIGNYLAVKTLINAILATISFGVMWLFGVDFALFWAIMIGLLNYIPYFGSLIGVLFPVALTMAQFGTLQTTVYVLVLLTSAQMWVGNFLEPRMIGKKVNLSPFIVLVSLSVWTSLWGIAGSILAIPMTAILAIVLSHFDATRPIAILLSDDPDLVTDGER
ncbi:AI-2E family transporter [Sulfitobacter sp. F26169L]|uniref:AI-2E family transporter n=1 Tax=Sulfitobacter sp. F26169L TaxID=2996015 RepID=UPI002260AAF3|nr:AI-2E family transporter [Sulfitobacter sp. F26169L]